MQEGCLASQDAGEPLRWTLRETKGISLHTVLPFVVPFLNF
jgi:hypothetical protein